MTEMTAINQTRMRIIHLILTTEDMEELQRIERQINPIIDDRPDVWNAVTTIRPFISLDEMVAQQNYQPITYQEFRQLADAIEIEEPIEELLGMLTK
jgi:hypothetical protein